MWLFPRRKIMRVKKCISNTAANLLEAIANNENITLRQESSKDEITKTTFFAHRLRRVTGRRL